MTDVSYGVLLSLTEGHGTSEIYERIQAAIAQAVEAALVEDRLARHDETVAAIEGKECLTCGIAGGHKSGCYELKLNDLMARLARTEGDLKACRDMTILGIRSQREAK